MARFSGEHGHPTTDNPTALYFNPAALRGNRAELFVDGLVGLRRVTYTRGSQPSDAPDPSDAAGANVGRAELSNWLASPSLWLVVPVSERLVLGGGVFTPFGGPIRWDTRDAFAASPYPGPVDGVSRFHAIEGLSITTYGSVGGSYALSDTWRLGLSLNGMYTTVEDVRAWSGGRNGVVGEGRSFLDVNGFAWGFGAGVFYECECRGFRAGLSYQSRPNVAGGMKLAGKLSNDIGGPSSANVHLHEDLPDVLRAAVAYEPRSDVELRASVAWERWSAFDQQCVTQGDAACTINQDGGQPDGGSVLQNVPRNFRDAMEARAGASVWTSKSVELFSGMGVMSKAVPDETLEAGLPDFFGVTFSLGSRLRLSDALSVAGSLSHIVSPSREAKSQLQSYALPSKLPDASGHYTQSMSYANLNVSVRF
ncbi:MAG: putative rane protein [Polyangiaceae bacterium]|nr:putative rane protein [Polyangiaceae bacterium]